MEYSGAVDVFSFGIILWQLVTCAQPYASVLATHNRFQLLHRIARDGLRPDVPADAPPLVAALMVECWADAEHERPAASELVRRLRQCYFAEFGFEWRLSPRAGEMVAEPPYAPDESASSTDEPSGEFCRR